MNICRITARNGVGLKSQKGTTMHPSIEGVGQTDSQPAGSTRSAFRPPISSKCVRAVVYPLPADSPAPSKTGSTHIQQTIDQFLNAGDGLDDVDAGIHGNDAFVHLAQQHAGPEAAEFADFIVQVEGVVPVLEQGSQVVGRACAYGGFTSRPKLESTLPMRMPGTWACAFCFRPRGLAFSALPTARPGLSSPHP